MAINFNQTSTISEAGVMEPATGSVGGNTFLVDNEFGLINIGVSALLGAKFLPVYISQTIIASNFSLQPVNAVQAWFALFQNTSMIFSATETVPFEVNYQGITTATISYSGPTGKGVWAAGPLSSSTSTTMSPTLIPTPTEPIATATKIIQGQ